MSKSEVKPLITFVFGSSKVVFLLLRRHSIPDVISLLVGANVEELCTNEDKYVVDTNANEYLVTATVKRLVVIAIDLEIISRSPDWSWILEGQFTLLATMDDAWTHMLYNAEATVRVRTVPALRDPSATRIACM